MIEEQAVVVEIKGGKALLEVERNKPCGLCGATRGCGISLWGRIFGQHRGVFLAENSLSVEAGDRVIVGIEEAALLSSSLFAYVLPLVFLCLGAWLIPLLFGIQPASRQASDLHAAVGALAGLAGGLLLVKWLTDGKRLIGRYQPVMLRRSQTVFVKQCSR
jgi:sigma-E factor negative regulatory protein RseC